jgi:hypothetical protein
MNVPATQHGKSARLRHWLARHLAAMIATTVVLATLGWESQYQEVGGVVELGCLSQWGDYGWPRACVRADDFFEPWGSPYHTSDYTVTSWPSLLLDTTIAVVSLVATWVVFTRTQRRCRGWWQLSLASLFAFVALAAVACAALKSESFRGRW